MDATHKTIGPLPSVDQLIQQTQHLPIPRRLRKRLIQEQLQQWRDQETLPAKGDISSLVEQGLCRFDQMRLRCVVNATGIVLHTNLGRAPLPLDLNSAIFQSLGYNNLELDLSTGKRGKRGLWVEKALATICQSPSSTVVNNCAAALMLILMAARRDAQSEVILSRGELVQIGGGFRIPEILESAGIRLREVGTTNHTTLEDYRRAIGDHTVMILKVHQSNFAMTGFVASPPLKALADLAREHDCPLVFDLGSGALVDTKEHFDIDREITPAEAIHQGVDLVCFSGDKLMGGPQAGIIAGNTTHINHLKQHPMFRALRIDKVTLGVLEEVAEHHLVSQDDPEHPETPSLPAYGGLSITMEVLEARTQCILESIGGNLNGVEQVDLSGGVGGGTMPTTALPSLGLGITSPDQPADRIADFFRNQPTPIIGHVSQKTFYLNLRTVLPEQDSLLIAALKAWKSHSGH